MSTHVSALAIGHRLQEYLIGRLLGHGGFGLTYLAQDTNLNSLVAIKEFLPQEFAVRGADSAVIPKSDFDADSYRWGLDRFKEEARALARFKHPNIVRVSRLLEANGTAYMVMDFEPGMTLSQYLKRFGPTLDEGRLLGLFLPVLDGLEALHRLQLVHRDIKPSNIYVRAYGGPMLIDFGAVRQAIGAHSRNLTSLVTPGYAPIEQYSSDGRQGAWSDLYAVGASLYYCMFGHAPADAARRSALISDGAPDPYVTSLSEGAGRYSGELLASVDWALQFRVKDRPQSAHDFREHLRESPVPPQIVELPESLDEVPELKHGVLSAPTISADPYMSLPSSIASDLTSARTRANTDLLTPGALEATSVNPASVDRGGAQKFAAFLRRLRERFTPMPAPLTSTHTTLTSRIGQHLREPRSVRIALSGFVVLAIAGAIWSFGGRVSAEQKLYDTAAAANTAAAYQQYLDSCRQCEHRADAQEALARLQKAESLATRPKTEAKVPHASGSEAERTPLKAAARKAPKSAKQVAAAGETLPQPLYTPAPKYPSDVKGGARGWVELEFTVNVDGSVTDIEILGSQPKGVFDRAATHAVHDWLYKPATLNGARERKRIRTRIEFKP
ncbi:MAG TPA: TonB family protein [Gammaproteobacteria bacterium]|nr:TonB family protein [Gammaproteobacteria bacterium]